MTQKEFYKSPPWKRARRAYIDYRISVDGGLCERCGLELGKVVHHWKTWLNDENCNDPEISLNFDNFRYECQTCHNQEKHPNGCRKRKAPGRCLYGEAGEIIRNTEY